MEVERILQGDLSRANDELRKSCDTDSHAAYVLPREPDYSSA